MRGSYTDDLDETDHKGDFVYYYRCQCAQCKLCQQQRSVCCREINHMDNTLPDFNSVVCITSHEGFENVCLNVWVLQAAYFSYRQEYGSGETRQHNRTHFQAIQLCLIVLFCTYRQYRFIAYRQLTGWCWGWLGRMVRVVLPSCVVVAIRKKFPSEQYPGFKYPCIDR